MEKKSERKLQHLSGEEETLRNLIIAFKCLSEEWAPLTITGGDADLVPARISNIVALSILQAQSWHRRVWAALGGWQGSPA